MLRLLLLLQLIPSLRRSSGATGIRRRRDPAIFNVTAAEASGTGSGNGAGAGAGSCWSARKPHGWSIRSRFQQTASTASCHGRRCRGEVFASRTGIRQRPTRRFRPELKKI